MQYSLKFRFVWPTAITILLAFALMALFSVRSNVTESLDYQGESFRLNQSYRNYDDFKEDPNNFDLSQAERIAELLNGTQSPMTFPTREELFRFTFELKVPGFGLSSSHATIDGRDVYRISVEIPKAGKERMLVYRQGTNNAGYFRLDDFVVEDHFVVDKIEIEGRILKYIGRDGSVIRQTELSN